jgi:hypothetical protein
LPDGVMMIQVFNIYAVQLIIDPSIGGASLINIHVRLTSMDLDLLAIVKLLSLSPLARFSFR